MISTFIRAHLDKLYAREEKCLEDYTDEEHNIILSSRKMLRELEYIEKLLEGLSNFYRIEYPSNCVQYMLLKELKKHREELKSEIEHSMWKKLSALIDKDSKLKKIYYGTNKE